MYCGKCGVENENGAKFCKACGAPIEVRPALQISKKVPKIKTEQLKKLSNKVKEIPKSLKVLIVASIFVLIIVGIIISNVRSTINLNKYVLIEVTGYDGLGKAKATIDWDAIEKDYGNKVTFTDRATERYGGLTKVKKPVTLLGDAVKISLDKEQHLTNEEEIHYTISVKEGTYKYFKCKLKFNDGMYKVSGLEEVGQFDAFEGLELTFSGIAPNGYADIHYTGTNLSYYDFSMDKNAELSNGDIITVRIDESLTERCAESLGKVPAAFSKEYKVEGLHSYIKGMAEIKDSDLSKMQNQASDVFTAYVAQEWEENVSLQSFTYIGDYFLTNKNQLDSDTYNKLYLVYKMQAHNVFQDEDRVYDDITEGYWYICFNNLLINDKGDLQVDLNNYDVVDATFDVDTNISDGWWSTYYWRYRGYSSLEQLYKDNITTQIDVYNHEDNVDESVAPVKEVKEESTEEAKLDKDFIFPNSHKELIRREDLEGLTKEECEIALNEIYAREGCKFADENIQAYFDGKSWYIGTIEVGDFVEESMMSAEMANRDMIIQYEIEQGYR